MSRSSANIANKVAKSGRKSDRRISEPPRRRNTKKRAATKKRPKRATNKRRKRNRKSRAPQRSRGFVRVLVMVAVMMGLGFLSILVLDSWAQGAPEIRERPVEQEEGATLGALVEKFIDRLLDRDLPGAKTKPTKRVVKVVKKPAVEAASEAPTKTTATYKAETKPLEAARVRNRKKAIDKRARLDALLETVGVPD